MSLVLRGSVFYKDLPIFPEGEIPYYISGADMMMRKSFIEKYGAFDPDFFMYYEDTELSYRVVMGDVVMKSLLLLHKIKAFIAIGYFVIRRNNEKIENWKKIKKLLFSISG